jgi:hypothetical protein
MPEFQDNQEEGKLEFLKRNEIRTMQGDLSRLREAEAEKEKAKISGLKTGGTKGPEQGGLGAADKGETVGLIPKTSSLASWQKILIRVLIALIVLSVAGFLYWFFVVKGQKKTEEVLPSTETPATKEVAEEVPEKPSLIIPESLIVTDATQTMEVANPQELIQGLPQLLGTETSKGLTRIVIVNTTENKVLGLKEFFEALGVKTPDTLLEKLDNDFTLLSYSNGKENRLALIAEVKDSEGLASLLLSWEETMKEDTENLLSLLGKDTTPSSSSFKEAVYGKAVFRYLSFLPDNFGLCWSVFGKNFVLTTSGESMIKILNNINP